MAPARESWLITRYTEVSFPGTSELASTTVSPDATVMCRWSPIGHPAQRAHRLALRAGRHEHDLVGRQYGRLVEPDHQAGRDAQQPEVAGDAHVAHHRPADERDLALVLVRRVEHLLHPVHVRGERRHDDPAARLGEHRVEHRPDVPLRRDEAGDLRVGGVREQQVDALGAEPREAGQVGDPPVERQLVHLEVAGVQHQPGRGPDGHGQRVRDGVVDREELTLERPQRLPPALAHGQRVRLDPPLGQLGLDQRERELRPDQRDVRLVGEQVRHGADVVLVAVGEHDRLDVFEPVEDRREVRQDQVDARLLDVGEEHAAVDDEQLAVVLEDGHVAPDGTEAAQWHHPQAAPGQRRRELQLEVRRGHRGSPPRPRSLRAAAPLSLGGRLDQRRAHRAGRQALRGQRRLDQDRARAAEDAREDRQQLVVQRQGAATSPALVRHDHLLGTGAARWVDVPTRPTPPTASSGRVSESRRE